MNYSILYFQWILLGCLLFKLTIITLWSLEKEAVHLFQTPREASSQKNSGFREMILQAKDSLDLFTLSDFRKDSEEFYITTDPMD